MSQRSALMVLLLLVFPSIGAAQEATDRDEDVAGSVISHEMFSDMRRMTAQFDRTRRDAESRWKVGCWKVGGVLIVNETKSYGIVGFHVDTARTGTPATPSRNQFGEPLRPMKVTMRFKAGGADTCDIPVRESRDRDTRRKLDVGGSATIPCCRSKAPRGAVTVLPADPEPATPAR